MNIKWFNTELSSLNIVLPRSRLLWNQPSDEICNFRPLVKMDSLCSPTEEPPLVPDWHKALCATCALTVTWAAHKPLIFSFPKSPGQLVFVFYNCSVLFFYLKFLVFHFTVTLPQNLCLTTRTRWPVLSLWKDRKKHDVWGRVSIPYMLFGSN